MTKITNAACCLHNYLKITEINSPPSSHSYCPPGYVDREDDCGNMILGDWRSSGPSHALQRIEHVGSNTYSYSAADLRDTVMNFMTTPEGEVSWQYAHMRNHGTRHYHNLFRNCYIKIFVIIIITFFKAV